MNDKKLKIKDICSLQYMDLWLNDANDLGERKVY